jgi:hypothetical protein
MRHRGIRIPNPDPAAAIRTGCPIRVGGTSDCAQVPGMPRALIERSPRYQRQLTDLSARRPKPRSLWSRRARWIINAWRIGRG